MNRAIRLETVLTKTIGRANYMLSKAKIENNLVCVCAPLLRDFTFFK